MLMHVQGNILMHVGTVKQLDHMINVFTNSAVISLWQEYFTFTVLAILEYTIHY